MRTCYRTEKWFWRQKAIERIRCRWLSSAANDVSAPPPSAAPFRFPPSTVNWRVSSSSGQSSGQKTPPPLTPSPLQPPVRSPFARPHPPPAAPSPASAQPPSPSAAASPSLSESLPPPGGISSLPPPSVHRGTGSSPSPSTSQTGARRGLRLTEL